MPVICPVAIAVGCRKCPIFSVCPVKTVIGDYVPPTPKSPSRATARKPAAAVQKPRTSKRRA